MNIAALYAGKPAPLGPRNALTAICKQPVDYLTVHSDCTDEDDQANKRLHGGPEKVLHQYSLAGYALISEHYPTLADKAVAGSIGENISIEGMTDETVFIGDVYAMGEIIVQVGAPRAPCNKINQRFETPNLDRFTGNHGITGWYYRILQTGVLRTGDSVSLEQRATNTVSVGELMRSVYNPDYFENARQIVELEVLDDEWRGKCEKALSKVG
ncbi:MOSC domain-containing protein [Alteromonas lipolytica]|uniref:Sulfurase n=1 Tax=Alteromonas lipolytica TaxID=1856405 RepID=A0A1E8F8P3_9ALTE|nr:MOSC domain-containing protein [Alteromonas lipolytica]OFI32146.1 sulfurase [Alteromonas lipolytica]GGF83508.1 molybdenum cofactor sulfurase [Alteromonas lipolytica]